jgi:hypothetical protein
MARRRKVKKRVCAIPRAPDGSAFFNWYVCNVFIKIKTLCLFGDFIVFLCLWLIECVHIFIYVVEHVGCLLLFPWLICTIVNPTRWNSKGFSELLSSELSTKTINSSSRINPFRLTVFLCNIPQFNLLVFLLNV